MYEQNPPKFNVSDRPWQGFERSIDKKTGFTPEYLDMLPPGARILISGSGLHRTFEKDVHAIRPDILLASIDPTLGIINLDEENPGYYIVEESDSFWIYYELPPQSPLAEVYNPRTKRLQQQRLERVVEIPGALAAWATELPFADGSFDMAIDVCGPVMYVPDEELAQYQQELIRVTKPDALIFSSNARRLCKNLEILT